MKTILQSIIMSTLFISFSFATIINVPADTSTIQGGIDMAVNGDTVLVADSTYFENINFKSKSITVASHFLIDNDTNHVNNTIIDGSQSIMPDSGSVITISECPDTNSVLCGFTITGGTGTRKFIEDSNYWIRYGGGILIEQSCALIKNNKITTNSVIEIDEADGGGIYVFNNISFPSKTVIFSKNLIADNSITSPWSGGGGFYIANGQRNSIIIENNIIKNNIVFNTNPWKAMGGGICLGMGLPDSGLCRISNNKIINNRVESLYAIGGALYIIYIDPEHYGVPGWGNIDGLPNLKIYNNLIADNHSDFFAGAISVWRPWYQLNRDRIVCPQPLIINNTIINNTAQDASAIFINNATPVIMNNILWNNTSTTAGDEIFMDNLPVPSTFWSNASEISDIVLRNNLINSERWISYENSNFKCNPIFADSLYNHSEFSPAVGMGRSFLSVDGASTGFPGQHFNFEISDYDMQGNIRPASLDTLIDLGHLESIFPANAYPVSHTLSKSFIHPDSSDLLVLTEIFNPYLKNIQVFSNFTSMDSAIIDTTELYDDGNHDDGQMNDGIYGGYHNPLLLEKKFTTSINIQHSNSSNRYNDKILFTTIGPVVLDRYEITSSDTIPNPGDRLNFMLYLKNNGVTTTATNITAQLFTTDSVVQYPITPRDYGDITAGATVPSSSTYRINFLDNLKASRNVSFIIQIASNDFFYWSDTFGVWVEVPTGIAVEQEKIPKDFALTQNYPNPFNPSTTIKFDLPKTSEVSLKIFNILGEEVAALVSEQLNAGNYTYQWDASNLPSGLYLYRLDAEEFIEIKKMILLR